MLIYLLNKTFDFVEIFIIIINFSRVFFFFVRIVAQNRFPNVTKKIIIKKNLSDLLVCEPFDRF